MNALFCSVLDKFVPFFLFSQNLFHTVFSFYLCEINLSIALNYNGWPLTKLKLCNSFSIFYISCEIDALADATIGWSLESMFFNALCILSTCAMIDDGSFGTQRWSVIGIVIFTHFTVVIFMLLLAGDNPAHTFPSNTKKSIKRRSYNRHVNTKKSKKQGYDGSQMWIIIRFYLYFWQLDRCKVIRT